MKTNKLITILAALGMNLFAFAHDNAIKKSALPHNPFGILSYPI